MKNLYLDPATYDLINDAYNLRLTETYVEYVSQKIENVLKTYKNEWFLDPDLGIPYFDRILIKQADVDDVNGIFLIAITEIDEIVEVISLNTNFDSQLRLYTVAFEAKMAEEEIIQGEVIV